MKTRSHEIPPRRKRLRVTGLVQGVGFRPFVYNLATRYALSGWVRNSNDGVLIEVQGAALESFSDDLTSKLPPHAQIFSIAEEELPLRPGAGFSIRESRQGGAVEALILPDLAPCQDCLEEIRDPTARRYRYPFTNCTRCGPRFSIVESLPYDRAHTTMRGFTMCEDCKCEYLNPKDRRFHAQPIACPACGPQLSHPIDIVAGHIKEGAIVALKGVGGYQLIVDAQNDTAIKQLRARKQRPDKPFALMCASLDQVRDYCEPTPLEEQLLTAPEAPIVLIKAKRHPSPFVAPQNPYLGVMLPASPLHDLLMQDLDGPIIATSGNIAGEPICINDADAQLRLSAIADLVVSHTRPIAGCVDDSVVRVIAGRPQILRRARGYASLPIRTQRSFDDTLAVGAQQKNTFCLAKHDRLYLSQHIGDLDNADAYAVFTSEIARQQKLYDVAPKHIITDLHPDYRSSRYAADKATSRCQHHLAHVYACMADNGIDGPLLGVAWDGTGLGADGTLWGGEFFTLDSEARRVAHLRPFLLPGGERAIKEPRLALAGLLYEIDGPDALVGYPERANLEKMLGSGFQAPRCSSVGRLFDAVAARLGILQRVSFEGQAALSLEFLAEASACTEVYPYHIDQEGMIDWEPMLREMHGEKRDSARRFHNTLAAIIVNVAEREGNEKVLLSGGVFQNKLLTEAAVTALKRVGFEPYWHQNIPPNDGGIAVGQILACSP